MRKSHHRFSDTLSDFIKECPRVTPHTAVKGSVFENGILIESILVEDLDARPFSKTLPLTAVFPMSIVRTLIHLSATSVKTFLFLRPGRDHP